MGLDLPESPLRLLGNPSPPRHLESSHITCFYYVTVEERGQIVVFTTSLYRSMNSAPIGPLRHYLAAMRAVGRLALIDSPAMNALLPAPSLNKPETLIELPAKPPADKEENNKP